MACSRKESSVLDLHDSRPLSLRGYVSPSQQNRPLSAPTVARKYSLLTVITTPLFGGDPRLLLRNVYNKHPAGGLLMDAGRRRAAEGGPLRARRYFLLARPPAPPRLLPRPCIAASSRDWHVACTTGRAVPTGFVLIPQALPTHRNVLSRLCACTNPHCSAAIRPSTRDTRDIEHAHADAVELPDRHIPIRKQRDENGPQWVPCVRVLYESPRRPRLIAMSSHNCVLSLNHAVRQHSDCPRGMHEIQNTHMHTLWSFRTDTFQFV